MKKKLTMEQWITACKKVIDTGDCEDLQKVLGYLTEGDRYMAFPYQREIVKYAAEKDEIGALRTILEHEKFMGMGVHLLKDALDQDSECLLELALDYVNPNALIHDEIFRPDEKEDEGPLAMFGEGVRYYVTAEPLGICAIQGKVKLAEILLERGARPNGSTAEDTMNNNAQMIRPFSYTKVEIHRRWKKDGRSMIE
ncbi:MAG: hypothetical protein J6S45_03365 [Firmicutes bacterium]|nr:hypothetical protein [Bacillota bacterium]